MISVILRLLLFVLILAKVGKERRMQKAMRYGLVLAACGLLAASIITVARSQELIIASAVMCDSEQQVRDFMAINEEAPEALKQVNEKHGDKACIRGLFHIMVGPEISTVQNHNGYWSIRQVAVFAHIESRMSPIHFVTVLRSDVATWFTAFPKPDRPA